MVSVRRAKVSDIFQIRLCSYENLPGGLYFSFKYYMWHFENFPELLHVAVNESQKIVGFIISKIMEETEEWNGRGHITLIGVNKEYRGMGLGSKLMKTALKNMQEVYEVEFCILNVSSINTPAISLYRDVLGFKEMKLKQDFYKKGDYAIEMRLDF